MAIVLYVPQPNGEIREVHLEGDSVENDSAEGGLPWVVKKGDKEVARFGAISGYIADPPAKRSA